MILALGGEYEDLSHEMGTERQRSLLGIGSTGESSRSEDDDETLHGKLPRKANSGLVCAMTMTRLSRLCQGEEGEGPKGGHHGVHTRRARAIAGVVIMAGEQIPTLWSMQQMLLDLWVAI